RNFIKIFEKPVIFGDDKMLRKNFFLSPGGVKAPPPPPQRVWGGGGGGPPPRKKNPHEKTGRPGCPLLGPIRCGCLRKRHSNVATITRCAAQLGQLLEEEGRRVGSISLYSSRGEHFCVHSLVDSRNLRQRQRQRQR